MDISLTLIRLSIVVLLVRLSCADDPRVAQFIGFTQFNSFHLETNHGALVLRSTEIRSAIPWNELVVSWNFHGNPTDGLLIEAMVRYSDHDTKWYVLGRWAGDPAEFPRQSVVRQGDDDADVRTDTLRTKRSGGALRLKVTLLGGRDVASLKFVGLSFSASEGRGEQLPPEMMAWGKTLPVPERTQTDYPEGISAWCSPAAVTMILSYWSQQLNRPDLEHDVPEVASAVEDPSWPGTGNWPFNMAFAGAHRGIRAYVARFSDVRELEQWIVSGVPVALSVSYGLLKGHTEPGNGHLVVCAGFTKTGDLVANDPGRKQVRQVYSRENLAKAWRESRNTVYLIYPENRSVPRDEFHHWFTP